MKRKITIAAASMVFVIFLTCTFSLQSHVVQPLTGGLANDPNQANCAACHSAYGAPISRNSQFILRIAPDSAGLDSSSSIVTGSSTYTPNHPNWISLDLTGVNTNAAPDSPYFGFQFTALIAANDSMAGTFPIIDSNNNIAHTTTEVGPYNGMPEPAGVITYVSHYNPFMLHSVHTWYFIWNAPDSSAGPVTFYYTGNLGNGNIGGDPNNDYPNSDSIFTGSVTLNPGPSSTASINNISGNIRGLAVYPVPFSQQLNADLYLSTPCNVTMTLLSIDGQSVRDLYNGAAPQGHFSRSFQIGDIAAGMYFVRVQTATGSRVVKVLKY